MQTVPNPYLVDTSALQTGVWDWLLGKRETVPPETQPEAPAPPQQTPNEQPPAPPAEPIESREKWALKFLQEQNQAAQFAYRLILWALRDNDLASSLKELTQTKQTLLRNTQTRLHKIDKSMHKDIRDSENLSAFTTVFTSLDQMLQVFYASQQELVYELEQIVFETRTMCVDAHVANICEWYWKLACYGRVKEQKSNLQSSKHLYKQSDGTYWKTRLSQERKNILAFLCTVVLQTVVPKLQESNTRTASAFQCIATDCEKLTGTATLDELQTALGRVWFLLQKAETLILYQGTGVYILSFIMSGYHLENMKPTLEEGEWAKIQQYYTKIANAEA